MTADAQPELAVPIAGLELDLVDREAQVVEAADPGVDHEAVVGAQLDLGVELVPQRPVAGPDALGGGDRLVLLIGPLVVDGQVGQPEGDVLDQDLEVVGALAVGQRRVDLAGLGVDEVGLDLVAVAAEEGVGQRAVAPVDAAAMEVDQERRHRVEEPVAVGLGGGRQAHQQAPVLQRVGQVGRDQDPFVALGRLGQPDRRDGRQLGGLEPAEDVVLVPSDLERLLLERVEDPAIDDEPDEVARRADRQLLEFSPILGPLTEGQVPGQTEQAGSRRPQAEMREAGGPGRLDQSRFRRYAVTVAS